MVSDLLDYRVKKHLADIDRLITELVLVRMYINSARVGFTYCRNHVSRGAAATETAWTVESDLAKSQELLIAGLKKAEKRLKRRIHEASRELSCVCRHERAAGLRISSD